MSDQNLPDLNESNQMINAQPETTSNQIAPSSAIINGNLFVTDNVAVGPFAIATRQGQIEVTGPVAEFGFARRDLTSWPAQPAAGNRFVWYNPDGTARLYTDVNGDLLTVTAPGNVGIGTTNPEAKLHISDPSFRGNMKLFATSGVGHDFGYDGGIDNFFAFAHYGLESGQTKFVWHQNEAATRDLLTIKNTGNIGIGTDNPLSMLHIGDGLPTPPTGGYRPWMVRGTLVSWDSDNVFFGLKNEGLDRKDSVIAWGDNTGDAFRFIFVGTGGPADGQEIMRLQPNGNVGIGTTNPQAKLQISDPSFRGNLKLFATSGVGHDFGYDGGIDNFFAFAHYGLESGQTKFVWHQNEAATRDLLTIKNTGNIGIGTTDADPLQYARLTIKDAAVPLAFRESDRAVTEGGLWRMPLDAGMLRFDVNASASGNFSPYITPLLMYPNGDIRGGQDVYANRNVYANGILLTSSRELKENIAELSGKEAVEALKNLNPVKFNFKADSDKNRHIGFIAEDVPELVATSDRKTLSPMDIVAVLTQALKEQQNTISALAEKVKLLEAKTA
jgi:hypothetical protein